MSLLEVFLMPGEEVLRAGQASFCCHIQSIGGAGLLVLR